MNNQKYLLYFVLLGIFCTFSNGIVQASSLTDSTLQKSTATENTTPQKKQKSKKSKSRQSKKNQSNTTTESSQAVVCPHADTPAGLLTPTQLTEVLACTQAQKKTLDKQVETLEQNLEQAKSIKKIKKGPLNNFLEAPRCPYSNSPLKKLKAEQLDEVYAYTQKNKMDSAFMIELLERLIALSDNHSGVKKYKLQLADTHYELHHLEKAAACYEDFAVLYPGSNENEYVLYKAVLCMFELSLDADRDQTNSKRTIALVKEFLKRAKKPDLIQEAKTILQKCYDRLYDHEVYVFNFYTKKKNFTSAQMRLDYIAKTFTETISDLTKKVTVLTAQLELAKNPVKPTKSSIMKKLLA